MPANPFQTFYNMAAAEQKPLLPKTSAYFFYLPTSLVTLPFSPERMRAAILARAALSELSSLPNLRQAIQNAAEDVFDPEALRSALKDCALLPKTRRLLTITLAFI